MLIATLGKYGFGVTADGRLYLIGGSVCLCSLSEVVSRELANAILKGQVKYASTDAPSILLPDARPVP